MPPNQQNPYDFIMNPQQPKRSFNIGGTGARIAVVAVGAILIILIFVFVSSFFNKDSKAQSERLVEIAQAQTEIIRVSALSKDKAKAQETRNYASNVRLTVESSQQQVRQLTKKRGINDKSLNKQLAAARNNKTDAALQEATQNNRFDETFTTILEKQLSDYQKLVKAAHDSGNANEKRTLKASFDSTSRLISKSTAQQ